MRPWFDRLLEAQQENLKILQQAEKNADKILHTYFYHHSVKAETGPTVVCNLLKYVKSVVFLIQNCDLTFIDLLLIAHNYPKNYELLVAHPAITVELYNRDGSEFIQKIKDYGPHQLKLEIEAEKLAMSLRSRY